MMIENDGDKTKSLNLISSLLRHVEQQPTKCAILLTVGSNVFRRNYQELLTESLSFAATYRAAGVGKNDVVLIFLRSRPEAYAAFIGAMLIGAIPSYMPCPSAKQHPEHYWSSCRQLFDRIRPKSVVLAACDAEIIRANALQSDLFTKLIEIESVGHPMAVEEIVLPESSALCLLQHSSGTTGLKKGVMLSYKVIENQVRAGAQALGVTCDDVMVTWLPVYHDMGLIGCTLIPLSLGQTIVALDPFEWSADPALLFRAIAAHRATICWMPNFAFEHITRSVREQPYDISSMRIWNSCSESCKPETFARFANRFGVPVNNLSACYGMAEAVLAVTQTQAGRAVRVIEVAEDALRLELQARPAREGEAAIRLLSNGMPVDGVDVRITGPDGRLCVEGEVGQIVVAGACLFDGYYKLPDVTAERLVNGWYHTRDIGFFEQGELFILGRSDDLIIVHGRNIYAHEVEDAAYAVEGVKAGRVVAFGIPNKVLNSEDIVLLAEAENIDVNLSRKIKEGIFETTGFVIREARLVPIGSLIKTTSGKMSRDLNRKNYLEVRHSAVNVSAPAANSGKR